MTLTSADVARARAFSIEAHGAQMYGDKPYVVHLDAVVDILTSHGYIDPALLITGRLHDVLEDTETPYDAIARRFGADVADGVWRVSNFDGKDPAVLLVKYYPKIKGHPLATPVKLADRITNLRASFNVRRKLVNYLDSNDTFTRGIYVPGLCEDLWASLAAVVAEGNRLRHAD